MIYQGDCLEYLRTLDDNSVDAVVTDPPYGLGKEPDPRVVLSAWLNGDEFKPGGTGFMGKAWDSFVPSPVVWAECYRVLKPGGHLLAFAGSRTYDWIALGVRLANFEIRDQIMWIYGSGFPKSHNVSKAIDRAAGAKREVVGTRKLGGNAALSTQQKGGTYASATDSIGVRPIDVPVTAPATEAAQRWQGWGTALKPAHEPIVVARKPLDGTVADNVLEYGTGAINVDACRVGAAGGTRKGSRPEGISNGIYGQGINGACEITKLDKGRWPANIVHDGSPEVVAGFPVTNRAARFFYTAKASRVERERGLSHREPETVGDGRHTSNDTAYQRGKSERRNIHPTVKPVSVMRWLVRLVTPPNGVVLDPYTGSGTTGIACVLEGFDFLGCELSPEYCAIAESRIAHAKEHPKEWDATHGDPTQTKLF